MGDTNRWSNPRRVRIGKQGPKPTSACAILVALVSLGTAQRAHAQDAIDPFELSPEELFAATVVSATKTEETWRRTPAAVYVLTSAQIRRSGVTTVPEALRFVPGVHVARFNSSGWAVSVRGFNGDLTNKLLVLIDGREVYNELFSGVYWDIQDLPLEDVERIEVIRGPGGTLWGSNAVNGVINIVTKSAQDTPGTQVVARLGDEGAGLSARHTLPWSENGDVRVYGHSRLRDGGRAIGGGGGDDGWSAFRGGFRGDWIGDDDRSTYTLQGDVFRSRAKQLQVAPSLTAPFAIERSERVTTTGWNLLGRYTRELGDRSRVRAQAYVDHTFRRARLLDDDFYAADLEFELQTRPWEPLQLVVGGGYRHTLSKVTGSPQVAFGDSRRTDGRLNAFVQGQLSILPDTLELTLGTKIESNDYSGTEIQPSARLSWTATERSFFWGSVSRAVRRPSRLEHDLDIELATIPPGASPFPIPVLVALQGNDDFSSEEVTAYELGFRHEWSKDISLDIATFYNRYDDLATNTLGTGALILNGVDPPHLRLPVRITNDTSGHGLGYEIVIAWQALESLRLSAAYTHLDLELSGPPSNIAIDAEAAEERAPNNQLNLRALWDIDTNTQLDASLYYTDAIDAFDLDSHWRFDLRLARRISAHLELALVGQDLFTSSNREFFERTIANVTEVERSVYAQVTWRY